MNETAHVLRWPTGMPLPEITMALEVIRVMSRVAPHALADVTGYSIEKASIPAVSTETRCGELTDEDMQNEHKVRKTTIRDPFAGRAR